MTGSIRAITFDAAGTLFRLARPVGETYAAVAREWSVDLPPEALDQAFRESWRRAPRLHGDSLGVSDPHEQERQWWRGVVEATFRSAARLSDRDSPDDDRLAAIFDALFDAFADPAEWHLYPETLPVLDRLAETHRLAVISNFDRRFHAIARGLGLGDHFEAVILSGEAGAAKPDRLIFDTACRALDLPPEAIAHVGDDPAADWQGAREAGFLALELRRPADTLESILLNGQKMPGEYQ